MKKILLILFYFICLSVNGQNFLKKGDTIITNNDRLLYYFEPEAKVYFASMETQWTTTAKIVINAFIKAQKDSGLWQKKDRVWILCTLNPADSHIDLKNQEDLTRTGTVVHQKYRGLTATGTSSYTNTNFNPVTDGVNYTLNSNNIAFWINNDTLIDRYCYGHAAGGNYNMGKIRGTSNKLAQPQPYAGSLYLMESTNLNSVGFYDQQRTGASACSGFKNGANKVTGTRAATALINSDIYFGRQNGGTTAAEYQFSYFEIKAGFTDAEILLNYQQIKTMLDYLLSLEDVAFSLPLYEETDLFATTDLY